MPAPSSRAVHLSEWRKNCFTITSGTCTAGQKADAYRAQLLRIQYALARAELSPAGAASLFRRYAERYSAVVDSDNAETGLNNYADSIFTLARFQQTDSDKWQSGLSVSNVFRMSSVQEMLQAGRRGRDARRAPATAPVVVQEEAVIARPAELSARGGSGESDRFPPAAPGPDRPRDVPGSSPRMGPPSPQPPAATDPTSAAPFGEVATAQFRATPFFGNVRKESHRSPKASTGLSAFSSPQPSFPSGCGNPRERRAGHASGSADAASPVPRKAFGETEEDGRREESGLPAFRTAKEQFWADQHKRCRQALRASGPPCGGAKKSLGASRSRGIFGKFVPPVPQPEGGEPGGGLQCRPDSAGPAGPELPADERLRNVEPKMIDLIMNEIVDRGPPVTWDDIAGVEFAKATIKEVVVWPMLRPDIFTGLRGPPKGILLFGPPGTGKTLIGKCIASQSGATFFSISASSLTSKWVGEGEKMVRALFAVARSQQPAVIFIDEIDSLLSQRGDGEHESSRRMKTEFLVQLDGATTCPEDRVLVVGATNRPQEIDEAARRRLAKRLYIPLPEAAARRQMVAGLLSRERSRLSEEEVALVVQRSAGFSGADVTQLCREAALGPIRSLRVADIATITPDQVPPIAYADFEDAFRTVRPSVSPDDLELYENWNRTFGCGK